jgi:hypothetical protein
MGFLWLATRYKFFKFYTANILTPVFSSLDVSVYKHVIREVNVYAEGMKIPHKFAHIKISNFQNQGHQQHLNPCHSGTGDPKSSTTVDS